MPTYKLYYFNAKGNAEVIRFVFAHAGVQYEDIRLTSEQWAEFKPKTPFRVIPVLDIDGTLASGSMPIVRYLAKQFGLAGDNDTDQVILEGAADAIGDFTQKLALVHREQDEARKEALKKELSEIVIPKIFGALEELAASNPSDEGWFYGSKATYVDFLFTYYVGYLQRGVLYRMCTAESNVTVWLRTY